MNRLDLVKRLRQEAGVAGNGPATTINQSGEMKRLVDWTDAAWLEIQGLRLWDWQWAPQALTIAAGQSRAAGTLPPSRWIKDATYLSATGARLDYMPWRDFAQEFRVLTEAQPTCWTVRPDLAVAVNAIAPAGGLALTGEGYARPVAFALDTDVPAMPDEQHMAIVWLALQKCAAFEEAGALYQMAEREYQKLMRPVLAAATPELELGGALC